MPPRYTENVVTTRSRDGFLLEGLVIAPVAQRAEHSTKLVWIHGVYAGFYAPPGLGVCRALAEEGITCVIGNNRGHNVGAWIRNADGRVVLAGGAWEVFADSMYDIAGWIDFAGPDQAVLAGHSLGGRKVTLYQSQEGDARVKALVLASPSARIADIDEATKRLADELIKTGRGADLLPIEEGWASSAASYVDRFRPGSVNEAFAARSGKPLIASIRVPVLALLGEKERKSRAQVEEELATVKANAVSVPSFHTTVIDGADHLYTDMEDKVASLVSAWIANL